MLCYKITKRISEIATDVNFLQLDSENIQNSFKALKLAPPFFRFPEGKSVWLQHTVTFIIINLICL